MIISNVLGHSQLLKIGEVSGLSNLPVKTIRYYEEIGLLSPNVERSKSGYRLFTNEVINRLAFIKRAQSLGLSLSEIQEILEVYEGGELPCEEVKQRLMAKVDAISQQIASLESLKQELQGLLGRWKEAPPSELIAQTICPNIQL